MSLILFEGFDIYSNVFLIDAAIVGATGASFPAGRFGGKALAIHMQLHKFKQK